MEENSEIEDLSSKLTNLAMLYKEYKKRHDPTMDIEDDIRIHKLIFSKTADTILNKDPDFQSEFRENYFKKLSENPSAPVTQLYADILFSEYLSITDGVSFTKLRTKLCHFFESRISYYHQYKFKVLLQWAYTVEFFDYKSIDQELENLQNSLEDSIERYQRLKIDDEIDKNNKRPIPKTVDGTDLYIHSENLLNSNIARDDIEVYLTTLIEKNTQSRVFENFLISAKWMHIIQKFEIWEKMVENLMKVKQKSMERLKIVFGCDYSYALFFLKSLKTKLKKEEVPGIEQEIEMPPTQISEITQLQGILQKISREFGLKGDMELDDGHSLAYQVTHLFPEVFELQKQKLEWLEYGNIEKKQIAIKKLEVLQFMKSHRVTSIRKNSSYSEADVPEYKTFKVSALKTSDWLNKIKLKPEIIDWVKKQNSRLKKIENINDKIKTAFNSVDNQDITFSNRILEDLALVSSQSKKVGEFEKNQAPEDKNAKKYFSILLAELLDKEKTSKVTLPTQTMKTLYTLVLLKNRKLKNKLIDLLNVFKSIERRINLDVFELEMRENLLELSISQNSELKSRRDKIEEIDNEVYVKDSLGEYIYYDCVLKDYEKHKKWMQRLGTFYYEKYESLLSSDFLSVDCNFLVCDLLEAEFEFSTAKYKLISVLVCFYNNTIEKNAQFALAQYLCNVIALRPRISFSSSYFYESYSAHTRSIVSQAVLLENIAKFYNLNDELRPLQFNIMDLIKIIEETSKTLNLYLEVESLKKASVLEEAIWDQSLNIWIKSLAFNKPASDTILIDKPNLIMASIKQIEADLKMTKEKIYPKIDNKDELISELSLACNYLILWESKNTLEKNIEECVILNEAYKSQYNLTGKDLPLMEQTDWGSSKFFPEVDEGPGNLSRFNFAALELDKHLEAFMNFDDPDCLNYLITPWGLEEILAITRYQIMEKQALAIAVQINQIGFSTQLKIISEIETYIKHKYVHNKYTVNWPEIIKKGLNTDENLAIEKKKARSKLKNVFCDIFLIKLRNRAQCVEKAKILTNLHGKNKKDTETAKIARRVRVQITSDYSLLVLKDLYPKAFKIQIIQVLQEYSKLTDLLSNDLYKEIYKKDYFFENERGLVNLETIPSISDVLAYPIRTLEDLSGSIRNTKTKSQFFYCKYNWNHNTDLLKILNIYGAVVQCIQIRLFLNFLCIPTIDILELEEKIRSGSIYWDNSYNEESFSNTQTMIEDQISDAFNILKSLNSQLNSTEKEKIVSLVVFHAKHVFNVLSLSLYMSENYLLQTAKTSKSRHLFELKNWLFRHKIERSINGKYDVILIENAPVLIFSVPGPLLFELEWGLIEALPNERNRGLVATTSVNIKIENMIRNIQNNSPIQEIKRIIKFLKPELKLWRLKSNFFKSIGGTTENYMNSYKNIIEDKAIKSVENIFKNRETAKVQFEIDLLKEYFNIETCRAAKEFLEKEIKNFAIAAENPGPFALIKPANFQSDFATKISLLNNFLNILKNRGTLIKNVPGGKGVSYSIKDLSLLAKRFGDQVVRYKDNEKRDHVNKNLASLIDTRDKLLEKEKELAKYKKEQEDIENEVLKTVNIKLTQKGSQIMNEMEISKKNLKEIKENAAELEKTVKSRITSDYQQKLQVKIEELKTIKEKFMRFQSELSEDYNANLYNLNFKNLSNSQKPRGVNEKPIEKPEIKANVSRVVKLQEGLRKLRKNLQWTRLTEMQKFNRHINELKEQLTSNQYLLEQLNESKSMESRIKQELSITQKSLNSTQNMVFKLKLQIKDMKAQQNNLEQFKITNNAEFLELQQEVNRFKNYELVDPAKLKKEWVRQDKFLNSIRYAELDPVQQYQIFHNKYTRQIESLKQTIQNEKNIIKDSELQLRMIKEENEGVEYQEEEEWKRKYLKLVKSRNVSNYSSRARIANLTPDVYYSKTKISDFPVYSTPQKSVNSIITNKSFISM